MFKLSSNGGPTSSFVFQLIEEYLALCLAHGCHSNLDLSACSRMPKSVFCYMAIELDSCKTTFSHQEATVPQS